jgi:hypothetical protein
MSAFVDMPVAQRIENMLEMMQRLGIEPVPPPRGAGERALACAVRACEACTNGLVCRDWLVRAAPTLRKAPLFCPNADRFAQLLATEMMTKHARYSAEAVAQRRAMAALIREARALARSVH